MHTNLVFPKKPARYNLLGRLAYKFSHWFLKDEIQFAHETARVQNETLLIQNNSVKQLVAANHSIKILCDRYWAELQGELH